MKSRLILLCWFGFLYVATGANGAPVTYTFSGLAFGSMPPARIPQAFVYQSPNFITADTVVPSGELQDCVNCGTSVKFIPDVAVSVSDVPHGSEISFTDLGGNYYFLLDSLSTLGLFTSLSQSRFPLLGSTAS